MAEGPNECVTRSAGPTAGSDLDEPASPRDADGESYRPQFTTPFSFGAYRLTSLIAIGGMAEVYLAHRLSDNVPFALKVLRTDFQTPDARQMCYEKFGCGAMEWEYGIGRRFSHPNVIRLFDHGRVDEVDYLALEYYGASTLGDHLTVDARERLFPHLSGIIEQCAEALGHMHAARFLHCDVKPSNFLLGEAHVVKLIDFDMAAPLLDPGEFKPPKWITASAGYISREQRHKQPLDERTDIYSLGMVIHVLLTGRFRFAERRDMWFEERKRTPLIPLPRRLNPDISEEMADLLARTLSDDKHNVRGRSRGFWRSFVESKSSICEMEGTRAQNVRRDHEAMTGPTVAQPSSHLIKEHDDQ